MKIYERIKLEITILEEDVVTLSGWGDEGLGTDLGDGQIGENDIFN